MNLNDTGKAQQVREGWFKTMDEKAAAGDFHERIPDYEMQTDLSLRALYGESESHL